MATYMATLRSKTRDRANPMQQKEFGGMEPGGFSFRVAIIPIQASSEERALTFARREARARNMILQKLERVVYDRTCWDEVD